MVSPTKNPMLRKEAWCGCRGCGRYFLHEADFLAHRIKGKCISDDIFVKRYARVGTGHYGLIRRIYNNATSLRKIKNKKQQ